MPINRTTLAAVFGRRCPTTRRPSGCSRSSPSRSPRIATARDAVVSTVGRRLYETFFEGYTRKQWGLDPSELDHSVTARVPARITEDDRYFLDRFQAMPRDGYTRMFERMLDHPRIDLALGTDFHDLDVAGAARRSTPARSTATSATASARCPTAASPSASRPTTAAASRRSASSTIPTPPCPGRGSPSTST